MRWQNHIGRYSSEAMEKMRLRRLGVWIESARAAHGEKFVYVNVDTREVFVTDHDFHANRKPAAANDNG